MAKYYFPVSGAKFVSMFGGHKNKE